VIALKNKEDAMKPKITIVGGCKVRIAGHDCKIGKISQRTIDMTPYAGEYVRIWLEEDGSYSSNKHIDHYWQIAEMQVPEQKYQEINTQEINTREMNTDATPVIKVEQIPIDLSGVEIITFDLP